MQFPCDICCNLLWSSPQKSQPNGISFVSNVFKTSAISRDKSFPNSDEFKHAEKLALKSRTKIALCKRAFNLKVAVTSLESFYNSHLQKINTETHFSGHPRLCRLNMLQKGKMVKIQTSELTTCNVVLQTKIPIYMR